ncbi:MAG TPA: nucleotidyltransferase family protein [Blastocatellia bacterium]|jgi:mannose-1-phosphate guanylyltransferase|nr:nucleotidyltransferase family protein [Blastocatellia bacterium]
MDAIVLAAGLGTRLWPLTHSVPKCLVPIGGRPLLAYWLDLLSTHGVKRVLINTHHAAEEVVNFVEHVDSPIHIILAHEPILLGSAGTLRANQAFAHGADEFFVVYADNLTDVNLTALLSAHRRMGKLATLGLFRATVPSECGVAILDENGIVTSFQEKPARPLSSLAFAGVMVATPAVFEAIPDKVPCDLGHDVIGSLVGRIAGWEIDSYLRDIGTPEGYAQAQADIASLKWDAW